MDFSLRPVTLPDDYPSIAAVLSAVNPRPVTAADLTGQDAWRPEGTLEVRLLAVDEAGAALGYAHAYRFPTTLAGKFYLNVAVVPAARRHSAGTALLTAAERFTAGHAATLLVGDVRDDDPDSLAYMQKRGYRIRRHGYDATLDLSAYDPAPFAGVVPGVAAGGIRFLTLAEAPGAASERALYELYARTMPDIPGYEAQGFMSFDTWHRFVVAGAGARPEWVIIAAAGDRYVGVTTLVSVQEHMYTHHTLVHPDYRGRKIALALKVLGIAAARRAGAPYLRTGNDSLNAPMLAVNRKLGYVPESGGYQVVRELPRPGA